MSFPFLLTSPLLKQMSNENTDHSHHNIVFNQIIWAGWDNRDVGGRIFPVGGFVEREGWEATAVSAVTGTRDCEHHPCNGMVRLVMESKSMEEESRWFKARTKVTDLRKMFW